MTLESGVPPRLSFAPASLLAAMWLQFALAIAGDKPFVACKFCGRFFEISTEQTGFRTHREFCSDSCKTMDYRRRKRMALRLASEGCAIGQIARDLKTKPATVRAFIRAARARSNSGMREGSAK
jgi:DNA-binding NarL/FixJ family response regulator